MKLSVCMIAKNEEKVLERCLNALAPLDAELVFTDTGSSDNTVSIAKRFTDRVYSFPWRDDFSAARNFCIGKASNDLILSLDCDEILNTEAMGNPSAKQLQEELLGQILKHPKEVGRLTLVGLIGTEQDKQESRVVVRRLFDRRYFSFRDPIHEQLVRKDGCKHSSYDSGLIFTHLGYDLSPEERKKKAERNNRLLFAERKKHPKDAYIDYQIGKSYILMEDNETALQYLESALGKEYDPTAEFVEDLLFCWGTLSLSAGRAAQAKALENYMAGHENKAELLTLMGQIHASNGFWQQALEEFSAALDIPECSVPGSNSYLPLFYSGIIYDSIGDKEMAVECLRASASMGYRPAEEELGKIPG